MYSRKFATQKSSLGQLQLYNVRDLSNNRYNREVKGREREWLVSHHIRTQRNQIKLISISTVVLPSEIVSTNTIRTINLPFEILTKQISGSSSWANLFT